jgi:hypothetical protein
MASISFFTNNQAIVGGSGLGFYGANGFGASVLVGEYQGRTYITNGAGTAQGPEGNNVKYLNSQSGILGQAGTGIHLKTIPNYQATLQIHFNHSSAVQTQNNKLYIYDRSSINNNPTGVICQTAELIHPNTVQALTGSGDAEWQNTFGSGSILSLCPSPGTSGQFAGNGSNGGLASTDHDHYAAISASPSSIGSKTQFGLYVSMEYF